MTIRDVSQTMLDPVGRAYTSVSAAVGGTLTAAQTLPGAATLGQQALAVLASTLASVLAAVLGAAATAYVRERMAGHSMLAARHAALAAAEARFAERERSLEQLAAAQADRLIVGVVGAVREAVAPDRSNSDPMANYKFTPPLDGSPPFIPEPVGPPKPPPGPADPGL